MLFNNIITLSTPTYIGMCDIPRIAVVGTLLIKKCIIIFLLNFILKALL